MRCGLEHRCNQCGEMGVGAMGRKPCARPVPAGSRPVGLLEKSTKVAAPPLDRLGRSSICSGLDLPGRSSRSWGDCRGAPALVGS
eukprot:6269378-Prymnesium_polylepis.1